MSRTTVAAVIEDADLRSALGSVLSEAPELELVGVGKNLAELSSTLEDPSLDVVLVHTELELSHYPTVIRDLQARRPFVAVLVIAPESDATLLSSVMELGARGVLLQPLSLHEVQTRIDSAAQWSSSLRQHSGGTGTDERGRIVAVAGARGGLGTSTVATLLAAEAARGSTVCLVDADLRRGSLAYLTDVKPRRNLVDLLDLATELTGRNIREVAVDSTGGFSVIGAPAEVERADDLTAASVSQVFHQLRFQYDVVIVDVGSSLETCQATILEMADDAVLVVGSEVASLHAARHVLSTWERLSVRPADSVTMVYNRADRRREVQPALAEKILGRQLAVTVPDAFEQLEAAHNVGNLPSTRPGTVRAQVHALATQLKLVAASTDNARHSRRRRSAGQAAIETPIAVAVMLVAVLVGIQGLLAATALGFARHAATEAAREMSVTQSLSGATAAARDALPSWSGQGLAVSQSGQQVRVSVTMPTVLPVGDMSIRVSQTASYQQEP